MQNHKVRRLPFQKSLTPWVMLLWILWRNTIPQTTTFSYNGSNRNQSQMRILLAHREILTMESYLRNSQSKRKEERSIRYPDKWEVNKLHCKISRDQKALNQKRFRWLQFQQTERKRLLLQVLTQEEFRWSWINLHQVKQFSLRKRIVETNLLVALKVKV